MKDPNVNLNIYGRTDVGRVRKNNEDAFIIADLMGAEPLFKTPSPLSLTVGPRGVLIAVSDGMGGAQAGEVASALTLHALYRGMPALEEAGANSALKNSVEAANKRVWQTARDTGRLGMGATLTAVLVHGRSAYVAEVGDSRAYLLRAGKILQLTRDQSVRQWLLDEGRLTPQEAESPRYKNTITQAMGTKPHVVAALSQFHLQKRDRLLLCSDGLTGKLSDANLQSIMMSNDELAVICSLLVETANERGGEDNITAVLVDIESDDLPVEAGEGRVSLETIQEYRAHEPREPS